MFALIQIVTKHIHMNSYNFWNLIKCDASSAKIQLIFLLFPESISSELDKIDKSKLLPKIEFSLLYELHKKKNEEPMYAREIAEELDASSNLIAARGRRLDEKYGFVKKSS